MPYPPIYIINLKRTPERKLSIQRQLDALNLDYEFVEAIDKYDLSSKTERAIIANQLDIDITRMESLYDYYSDRLGVLACRLSHVKVYNLIIGNNIPYACVLEDDVHLLPTFPKVSMADQKIPWDILMLSNQSIYIQKVLYPSLYSLYKLIRYKKYYPELSFYTVRLIALKTMKLLVFPHKIIKMIRAKDTYFVKSRYKMALLYDMTCEIGSIPNRDKHSWYKVTPNCHITTPAEIPKNVTSGMAYMLTHSAAIKWRQTAIFDAQVRPIDMIPFHLHINKYLNLYIVTPPCVKAMHQFLINSIRLDPKVP